MYVIIGMVKSEVTIDRFRFDLPYLIGSISEIDMFSEFTLVNVDQEVEKF